MVTMRIEWRDVRNNRPLIILYHYIWQTYKIVIVTGYAVYKHITLVAVGIGVHYKRTLPNHHQQTNLSPRRGLQFTDFPYVCRDLKTSVIITCLTSVALSVPKPDLWDCCDKLNTQVGNLFDSWVAKAVCYFILKFCFHFILTQSNYDLKSG